MGNAHAASAPPPPSASLSFAPPIPTPDLMQNVGKDQPSASPSPYTSPESTSRLENPGTIEDIHKKCKDVFPINFEGAKLVVNKGLSHHFQISHTINMSSMTQSGYRFGATYVGTKQYLPTEGYPVLLGDIDSSGNLNATVIHQFCSRVRGKLIAQVQKSKFTTVHMMADYRGDAFTTSVTLANPDIVKNFGVFVLHHLHSITPSLVLGGELAYQRGPAIHMRDVVILSAVGRYTMGDSTISGNIGTTSCHLCFHQKASEQLEVGVELEINSRIQESVGTLAYMVDLPKADLVFRGSVDTNWTVGAVLEKKLQPLPISFALSGMLNHSKQQFRLGCGLIIG